MNPTTKPRQPRKRRELPRYLTADEIAALFRVIESKRDRAIFEVAYFYGLRASEVGLLDISDWRDSKGSRDGPRKLYVHRLKGSDDSDFSPSNNVTTALRGWMKLRGNTPGPLFPSHMGEGISRGMLHLLMKKYCSLAGIDNRRAHFHTLKHSICTNLLEAGEQITDVQNHVGHRNINNTMIYAKITSAAIHARENRLRGFGGSGRRT